MNFERLNARDLAIGLSVAFVFGGAGAYARGGGGWGSFFIGGFGLVALFLILALIVAKFKK